MIITISKYVAIAETVHLSSYLHVSLSMTPLCYCQSIPHLLPMPFYVLNFDNIIHEGHRCHC